MEKEKKTTKACGKKTKSERKKRKPAAKSSIKCGENAVPNWEEVLQAVSRLAFGNARDCAKLVTQKHPYINRLDLNLLAEIRRNDKGGVDVRTVDRIAALRLLAELLDKKEPEEKSTEEILSAITAGF